MHEYVFILGREPELSVAELEASFLPHGEVVVLNHEAVCVKTTKVLPNRYIDRLGGTVKIGEVVERLPKSGSLIQAVTEWLTPEKLLSLLPESARDLGFSAYGGAQPDRDRLKALGMSLKKELRNQDRAIRIVASNEPQLSAVTVQRQGLISHGLEILVVVSSHEFVIAKTIAVQDYQTYSLRDFGRPAADPKRGMIPPKLAQIMLNLGHATDEDVVLDPFCGVGTVVQEAILLGVKKIYGSDTDHRVVKNAQENVRWLLKEFPNVQTDVEVTRRDARDMTIHPTLIVTEPDLGTPLRGHEPATFIEREARRLETLYMEVLTNWKHSVMPGGRVVMVWPVFQLLDSEIALQLDARVKNLGWVPQQLLSAQAAESFKISNPLVLEYAREKARVKRQVRVWVNGK